MYLIDGYTYQNLGAVGFLSQKRLSYFTIEKNTDTHSHFINDPRTHDKSITTPHKMYPTFPLTSPTRSSPLSKLTSTNDCNVDPLDTAPMLIHPDACIPPRCWALAMNKKWEGTIAASPEDRNPGALFGPHYLFSTCPLSYRVARVISKKTRKGRVSASSHHSRWLGTRTEKCASITDLLERTRVV